MLHANCLGVSALGLCLSGSRPVTNAYQIALACPPLLYFSEDAAGVADGDDSGGDVAGDDGACSYRAVAPYADSGKYGDIPAEPDIVSDCDRLSPFDVLIAPFGVGGVYGGVETAIRAYIDVVTEFDFCLVQDDEIVIREEEIAHFDIAPIITMERGVDVQRLASAS